MSTRACGRWYRACSVPPRPGRRRRVRGPHRVVRSPLSLVGDERAARRWVVNAASTATAYNWSAKPPPTPSGRPSRASAHPAIPGGAADVLALRPLVRNIVFIRFRSIVTIWSLPCWRYPGLAHSDSADCSCEPAAVGHVDQSASITIRCRRQSGAPATGQRHPFGHCRSGDRPLAAAAALSRTAWARDPGGPQASRAGHYGALRAGRCRAAHGHRAHARGLRRRCGSPTIAASRRRVAAAGASAQSTPRP